MRFYFVFSAHGESRRADGESGLAARESRRADGESRLADGEFGLADGEFMRADGEFKLADRQFRRARALRSRGCAEDSRGCAEGRGGGGGGGGGGGVGGVGGVGGAFFAHGMGGSPVARCGASGCVDLGRSARGMGGREGSGKRGTSPAHFMGGRVERERTWSVHRPQMLRIWQPSAARSTGRKPGHLHPQDRAAHFAAAPHSGQTASPARPVRS